LSRRYSSNIIWIGNLD